jgi:hypothetical protein
VARGESTATGTRELISVSGTHWKISWSVPEAKLHDVGLWDPRHEPPLSISRAISIARDYLHSTGYSGELPVIYVTLRRPVKLDLPGDYYFYVICFKDRQSSEESRQDPWVVVLLDGTVVTPVRTSS